MRHQCESVNYINLIAVVIILSSENEIDFLRETEEMIRLQKGLNPQRQYDSDWPTSDTPRLAHTGGSRSLPALPLDLSMEEADDDDEEEEVVERDLEEGALDREMEASLDRLLEQQMSHRNHVHQFLRSSSLAARDGDHEGQDGGDTHSVMTSQHGLPLLGELSIQQYYILRISTLPKSVRSHG